MAYPRSPIRRSPSIMTRECKKVSTYHEIRCIITFTQTSVSKFFCSCSFPPSLYPSPSFITSFSSSPTIKDHAASLIPFSLLAKKRKKLSHSSPDREFPSVEVVTFSCGPCCLLLRAASKEKSCFQSHVQ